MAYADTYCIALACMDHLHNELIHVEDCNYVRDALESRCYNTFLKLINYYLLINNSILNKNVLNNHHGLIYYISYLFQ